MYRYELVPLPLKENIPDELQNTDLGVKKKPHK